MIIRTWDYAAEYRRDRKAILSAVDRVFESGQLILGPHVQQFEDAFARYCGATHGVGVDNGTNALLLGLKALGVQPGAEVITVPNTAIPTAAAIVNAGATPRFVDVDPVTLLMDVEQLRRAVTPRTAAIVPVHLFGQCVDMPAVCAVAATGGIHVLEDCAQSHGAACGGQRCGTFGSAAAFSMYPTKTLGAYGDAGMVITSDDAMAARVRRLRMYGMDGSGGYSASENGYNARLDEVQAAILLVKLARLDEDIRARQAIAARYDRALAHTSLTRPVTRPGNTHTYHQYVCRHPERDRVLAGLARHDIHLNVHYPRPLHLMPAYERLGYREGAFPEAERAAREVFSLPMYPGLEREVQTTVCRALGDVLGETVTV